MIRRITVTILGAMLAVTSKAGWTQSPVDMINPQQVVAALMGRNILVSPEQVILPSRVPARTSSPSLDVVSASRTDLDNTKVRLRCRDSRDCLPFYAVIRGRNLENGFESLAKSAPQMAVPSPVREPWLVRSGERAILVLEGGHLRIEMPVICLSNGSAGKSIRVTTTNRKQVYQGQVAGIGLLKGGL